MTDLPRREFTSLPPPPHGIADARRRGQLRRRRQQTTVGAAALAVVASVLGATVINTSTAAVDRLEPAPFATAPARTDTAPTEPSPSPGSSAALAAPAAPAPGVREAAEAASSPEPTGQPPAPVAQGTAAAEPSPAPATGGPRLIRTYDPPTGNDTTICGGRISSGIGPPQAQTGWCVMAAVQRQRSGTDLSVRVCRSSEGDATDLHVDEGAVVMRVEQDGVVVWRLPAVGEPAAVLRIEPAGCWVWTWRWDGRGDGGQAVPPGDSVLHVAALADEVRDLEDQEQFTREG